MNIARYYFFNARVLLVLGLLVCSIVFFSVIPQSGFVFPHLVNSGHAVVFCLGTYLLMLWFAPRYELKNIILMAVLASALGILIEVLQPLVGRQQSLVDVWYDLLGCAAAALWYYASQDAIRTRLKHGLRALSLFLLVTCLFYPAYRTFVLTQVEKASPVLADFEPFWWSKVMWANNRADLKRLPAPAGWSNQSYVGLLECPADTFYPGLSFAYLIQDWSHYDSLEFEIFSTEQVPFNLVLRVHDDLHQNAYRDRFNKQVLVQPGLNRYRIDLSDVESGPQSRHMDMTKIADLKLFMARPQHDTSVYIDNIRLSKLAN